MKAALLSSFVGLIALAGSAQAQLANSSGGLLLGGGYLEDPETGYGFGQLRWTFYEDDSFAHTFFLDILGHVDDADLIFDTPQGVFTEDGDITFINITLNYELEAKLFGPISVYAGGGAGVEIISLDDRFNFEVDSDTNFVAQFFAGLRADFGNGFHLQAGARFILRDDFELLGGQFVTEDTFGFELAAGFQF